MTFVFDLISDLHIDSWGDFSWESQATSPVCIVAGDIGRNRPDVLKVLHHLGQCYQAVFYIDGNDEHSGRLDNMGKSYLDLARKIDKIPNVVYLQDNMVIADGVAILGTNGWCAFDFDSSLDSTAAEAWCQEEYSITEDTTRKLAKMAATDAAYMMNSVKRLQTHRDVKKIIMVTHFVPDPALIAHDIDLAGTMRFNVMGNRYMMQALAADTENKIDTWCFGHYHGSVDQTRSNVRFINNCRGRADAPYAQQVYYPKRVVVNY
jgi:predicted phosphodiesterase